MTPEYKALLAERRKGLAAQLAPLTPSQGPLVLEIGSGHGHFLTAYAQAFPKKICLGIDRVGERVARSIRKRDRARLANLHFIRAEASVLLATLPRDCRCSEVFVLFPDPWPKLRHQKHRLLQEGFLTDLAEVAEPGCPLHFRTDFRPYFESVLGVLRTHSHWEVVDEPWPFECPTVFQARADEFHSVTARRRP